MLVQTFVYVCLYDCVDHRRHTNLCQSISVCVGGGQMQLKNVFLGQGRRSVELSNTQNT